MAIRHFSIFTTNDNAGGGVNPATSNYYIELGARTEAQVAALIVAAQCYYTSAVGTRVQGISVGAAAGGGQLPIPFPAVAYGILQAADAANLPVMAAYGTAFGAGVLAVAGTGLVCNFLSATPGRSGRGRATSAFLSQTAVTASGQLGAAQQLRAVSGAFRYLVNGDGLPGMMSVKTALGFPIITSVTVPLTLGRVRSRRA